MKAERWRQIEVLFYAALERDAAERASFLAESGADREMREEVKNLLLVYDKNKGFLENPSLENSVSLLVTRQNQLSFGQKIGAYRALKLIGTGGMGEVYLAEDTRLKRQIALKVLSPEFVAVPNLIRRFQQEARAASALNHPNILTIYEVGRENSIHYIAAEYVDGLTVRQMIADKQTTLGDILGVAAQVASALTAAHEAGIVHRDIKPQNLMRRHDGYVKVLDFGIAKLIEGQFQTENSAVSPDTATGAILGTATYMSPEQARGLTVDARSDIWSLGVTLYEMVTRQTPFKGETTSDMIVSILEREPLSVAELLPIAPRELDAIIKRCLAKDVDSRYQNAEELGRDLRHLQQQTESSGEAARLFGGKETDEINPPPPNDPQRRHSVGLFAARWRSNGDKSRKDSSKYWPPVAGPYFVLSVISLCILIGVIAVNYQPNAIEKVKSLWSKNSVKSFQLDKITRLTNSGNVMFANISPDGKYAAYVVQEADQQSLWIRQVAAAPSKMILPSTGNLYKGLTFSPDSNFIYFVVYDKAKGMGVLHAISTLGGEPRKILEDVDSPITFSPDGNGFAFMRQFDDNGVNSHALLIANAEGQPVRRLAVHRDPNFFSREGLAWSPDGKTIIAAATKASDSAQKQMQLVEIQVADGSEKPFTSQQWQEINRVSWFGKGIVMTALDAKSGPQQVVQISYPEGEVKSVTNNLTGYRNVGATSDGRGILAVESDRVSHIWTAPASNLSQMKRITPGNGRYYQTSWTPEGKIIYVSEESGNQDVWTMEADGSNAKQLTHNPATDIYPKVSPDGKYIVFASNRGGTFHLWRMDRDGSNLLELTNGADDNYPEFSPEGKFIYFITRLSGKGYISRIAVDGGARESVFVFQSPSKALSPDGGKILCLFLDEQTNLKWQVGIALVDGENIIKTLNISTDNQFQFLQWATDGRAIVYTDALDNLNNLWNYSINTTASPKKITNFDSSAQILYFNWSPDGQKLVCLRGNRTNDVVYLNDMMN